MPKKTLKFDTRHTMKGNTYEIFHYLDMKTHNMEAHYHDFYEVFIFLDGEVDYWVEGNLYHLKPGDILFIDPVELHRPVPVSETGKYERIVLWINKSFIAEIENGILAKCFDTQNPLYSKVINLTSSERNIVQSVAEKFFKEYHSDDFCREIYCYGMLLQLMTILNRIAISHRGTTSANYGSATFITEILAYINKNYSENLSLDMLSEQFYISKYYLSHEFKRTVGTSVHRYIMLKRLNIAHDLLVDGIPPGQVSTMCGFCDYTNFFKAFKAEYGISPSTCFKQSI